MRSSPFEKVGRLRPSPRRAVKQILRGVSASNVRDRSRDKGRYDRQNRSHRPPINAKPLGAGDKQRRKSLTSKGLRIHLTGQKASFRGFWSRFRPEGKPSPTDDATMSTRVRLSHFEAQRAANCATERQEEKPHDARRKRRRLLRRKRLYDRNVVRRCRRNRSRKTGRSRDGRSRR